MEEPSFADDVPAQLARSDWLEEHEQPEKAAELRAVCKLRVLLVEIASGTFDQGLSDIADMLGMRRRALTKGAARVRFNNRIRPLYLIGQTAVVVSRTKNSYALRLDIPCGRFTNGRIRAPLNTVDFI